MTLKEKQAGAFQHLQKTLGYTNPMQAPRVMKVVLSTGVGSQKDKKRLELIANRLAKITGQKASVRGAKKSVAAFKLRQGDTVGYQVTLRGPRMWSFLEKLFMVSLPRTRDFRGVSTTAVDDMGNLTIGIKEHTIFPETGDEELKDVFGLAVTLVTTAKNKQEARAFFDYLGVPFKK